MAIEPKCPKCGKSNFDSMYIASFHIVYCTDCGHIIGCIE